MASTVSEAQNRHLCQAFPLVFYGLLNILREKSGYFFQYLQFKLLAGCGCATSQILAWCYILEFQASIINTPFDLQLWLHTYYMTPLLICLPSPSSSLNSRCCLPQLVITYCTCNLCFPGLWHCLVLLLMYLRTPVLLSSATYLSI